MTENHAKRSRHIIRSFEAEELKKRPFVVKLADALTSRFGTITFLTINVVIYAFWILMNTGRIPGLPVIDPYPYSFMNSFVSIEAIILSIIVLMSQNRENQREILRNELGLQVELISEKQITKILELLKELHDKEAKDVHDEELEEMTKELDTSYIERKLNEQLNESEKK
jgi:uncharacterized membrane protein